MQLCYECGPLVHLNKGLIMKEILLITFSFASLSCLALTKCERNAINFLISNVKLQGHSLTEINSFLKNKKDGTAIINYNYSYVDKQTNTETSETKSMEISSTSCGRN